MLSHTHMHTAEDREGLAVLSHTCTQARTWKDHPCCLTHVHIAEDQEGPPMLSHTHMYTGKD